MLWNFFSSKCFSGQRQIKHAPQGGKMTEESLCLSWQLKPKRPIGFTRSFTLFFSSLTLGHLFYLPQLIHIVTPFNRGQAVKDPITEVKHTFHIFSVDSRVWTTNFMLKCIEIRGEFMCGVEGREGEEGKVERLEREGSVRMEGPESGVSERFKR